MDWDLWIRIGMKGKILCVPEYFGNLREYPAAKSSSGGMARFRELVLIMRRYGNRRFPMAYLRYGWEPFQEAIIQRISQALGKADLDWLSKLAWNLRKIFFYLYFKKLTRLSYPCQFPDGWISDHAFFAVPNINQTEITLLLSTKNVPPSILPLSIKIRLNGLNQGRHKIHTRQDYGITLSLPGEAKSNRWHELEISASGYFQHSGDPFQNPRYSFQIKELR
jgi:hypothetical protein